MFYYVTSWATHWSVSLADEEEVDFEGFLRILRSESLEGLSGNLDQYESRFPRPASSENLAAPGSAHAEFGIQLEPVKE